MALGALLWPAVARVRAQLAAPASAQRRALARILADVAPTPLGRSYDLDPRMPLEEFAAVPATGDAELRPFVERIVAGERRATSVAGVVGLVRTAGTTGPSRLLPVTAAQRADLLAFARRLLLGQLHASRSPLPSLPRWLLVTASTQTARVGGLPVGYVSGLVQDAVRRAGPAFALPDPDVAAIEDREARLDRIVAVTRGARVGTLFGVPADLVALLERMVALAGRPAGEVWPTLGEVYWIGSHLGPARARIEKLVGRRLAFREIYGGAEGAFGSDWRGEGRLALVPDRVVFAFRPVEAWGSPAGPRTGARHLLLEDLLDAPVGARFELLVTTAAGLIHYRVGDIVEVTGRRPLTVAVAGRVGEILSLAGEQLVPAEAQAALALLAGEEGLLVDDWLVAPVPPAGPGGRPRHRWVLEGVGLPGAWAEGWPPAHRLDAALRRVAPAYARARAAGRLDPPELLVVPRGAFDRHRALAWPPGGPVKLRPFASSWEEACARPGLEAVLAPLR